MRGRRGLNDRYDRHPPVCNLGLVRVRDRQEPAGDLRGGMSRDDVGPRLNFLTSGCDCRIRLAFVEAIFGVYPVRLQTSSRLADPCQIRTKLAVLIFSAFMLTPIAQFGSASRPCYLEIHP